MIKASFLKTLDCTKADLTEFVKCPPLAREKTKLYSTVRKKVNFKDDAYGVYDSASSCCGVCELSELEGSRREVVTATFLSALLDGWKFFVYYSITPSVTRTLKTMGFKQVDSFRNPNTGRTVTVLTLKV